MTTTTTYLTPAKYQSTTTRWDDIIIGTGMGGMACGAALAKFGHKVLLLEQHYVPGGMTHTFSRKGYHWDVGVHCLGEQREFNLPHRLLRWLVDEEIEMKSLGDPYERFLFSDGTQFEYPDSLRKYSASLKKLFPDESAAIDAYFEHLVKTARGARWLFLQRTFPKWADRASGAWLERRGYYDDWGQTTREVLNRFFKNEKLKTLLCLQWGYYGSPPSKSSFGMHAVTTYHFGNGGYYPVSGSGVFAERMLKTVRDAGGEVLVRATVDEVITEGQKAIGVRLSTGQEYFGKRVISAAGAKNTVRSIVPEAYRRTDWGKSIAGLDSSPAYLCLNLGFEGDIQKAGASPANVWLVESWDMEWSEWDVADPKSIAPILYVSFPSLKDPKHVPGPNQMHTGEAVTFVNWSNFSKWQHTRRGNREPDYAELKKSIESRMIDQLKKHLPQLMSMVKYHELSTPLSAQFFVKASEGAIYGLAATPERFLSPHLRVRSPLKNFFMTGGDVVSLGVTGALMSGVLTASSIERRILKLLM